MDELIAHLSEKTYAYGTIRAENQNLLFTISELKTRLTNVEKGMNAESSVRRSMNRDSHVKDSVLANSKKPAKKVAVYVRKKKQTDITSETVISNKENVIDIDVAKAHKAKTLLCVSSKSSITHSNFPSDHSKLELLHMDLCGPMRVASINGKKYILVIVDNYSRYTWVYFLHSKDETPEIIKKFIAQAQLNYKAKVYKISTDNGIEFKNATLKAHYEKLGIMQQFSAARTPHQNGVVESRNQTLVEAARTMLIFS
ncbi:putative ribonuclease H-like domain-containing protein [Tanacetum coccineum]